MTGMTQEPRLLYAVLASLAAAPLILASDKRPNLREAWTFLAALGKAALVWSLLPEVLQGRAPELRLFALAPGFELHLKADALGMVFALLASGLWVVTSLYSIGYMRGGKYPHQTGYFASFAVCVSAAVGIAFAANLLTFFLFFELLTVATYPLVVHNRNAEAVAGGRKYLAYTLLAGQALLLALVWTQSLVPYGQFTPGGFLDDSVASPAALRALLALFIVGIGVKAALLPLHGWLPAAMVAPTPVSALLHAVAVVKAGAFGSVRVAAYVFGPDTLRSIGADWLLASLAAATILAGSLRALGELNFKRRLAYSTVSQLSYIVLGAVLGSPAALAGAIFHMAAHGYLKITLFFCAGSVYTRTHKTEIPDLAGLGRRMPVTFAAFTIGALGLTGMPLLPGFVSKWNLALGSVHSGHAVFAAVLLASGLLNFAYFFPIVRDAFFGEEKPAPGDPIRPGDGRKRSGPAAVRFDEASPAVWLPPAVTAAASLALGVWPDALASFYRLAWMAANAVAGLPA